MYPLNCIDTSESEAFNTLKSIFWTFFFFTVTLLPPGAEFRISSETLYNLLLREKVPWICSEQCSIMCMWIYLKSQSCINRALCTYWEVWFSKENCVSFWRMPLCFQAWLFNTHFRGGLSAYGILAGWVCFPWDTRGIPGKKWKTHSVKCFALSFQFSTIKIKHSPATEHSYTWSLPQCRTSLRHNTAVVKTLLSRLILDFIKQQTIIGRWAASCTAVTRTLQSL